MFMNHYRLSTLAAGRLNAILGEEKVQLATGQVVSNMSRV